MRARQFLESRSRHQEALDSFYHSASSPCFSISVIALVGHVLTQSPHPKQRSLLMDRFPFSISLAPNWHLSTQTPTGIFLRRPHKLYTQRCLLPQLKILVVDKVQVQTLEFLIMDHSNKCSSYKPS